jgi:AmmeMemoRadiSam system protein B
MLERPALRRFIEPLPTRMPDSDERMFALRDPFKLSPGSVILSGAGLALVSLLDGSRTLPEVLESCAEQFHFRPTLESLEGLLASLDDAGLLEGPGLAKLIEAFTSADVRPPSCIGSYPGDPEELRTFLQDQYSREGGPGRLPGSTNGAAKIRGIISPHIDMHRGGHAYAWPWREVASDCDADLFVIFGTSHMGTGSVAGHGDEQSPLYALTRKAFETPLGTVPTDVDVVDRLIEAHGRRDGTGQDLLAGEFHHRGEHSIEFQVVYLAHLFAGQRPIRILPVLCGSLHELESPPTEDPRFVAFHKALREALAPIPRDRVAFVAGIDLAHVGAQFHEPPVSEGDLVAVEEADRRTLAVALDQRCPDALYADITTGGDWRNICGTSALVGFLEATRDDPLEGQLLCYTRWHDGESAVSFAGAVYREKNEPEPDTEST